MAQLVERNSGTVEVTSSNLVGSTHYSVMVKMLYSATITKPKRNVFAVLDIGTSKVICCVVRLHSNSLQISGVGYRRSEGISGGAVTNIESAQRCISTVVEIAERASEETIDSVYVNVSDCGMSSSRLVNEIVSSHHEISQRDERRIVAQTYEQSSSLGNNRTVIHNIPVRYTLDGINVTELRGLYGSKLRADMHVVTVSQLAICNVENCITGCNLNMSGCITSSYSSGLACISKDDKELGTVSVDIGGGCTSIGIFDKGRFIHAAVIPIGGNLITRDISCGLYTSRESAERIKVMYGSSVATYADNSDLINVERDANDEESSQISRAELISIIRPRVEEILELVSSEISSYRDVIRKVVITGGTSKLSGIKELASHMLNIPVKIGLPVSIPGMTDEYDRNAIFSSTVGAISLIFHTFYNTSNEVKESINFIQRMIGRVSWIKVR